MYILRLDLDISPVCSICQYLAGLSGSLKCIPKSQTNGQACKAEKSTGIIEECPINRLSGIYVQWYVHIKRRAIALVSNRFDAAGCIQYPGHSPVIQKQLGAFKVVNFKDSSVSKTDLFFQECLTRRRNPPIDAICR